MDDKHDKPLFEKQVMTMKVLTACADAGIQHVAIGVVHPLLPPSEYWGSSRGARSIVTDDVRVYGWPAVWHVMEMFPDLKAGCGNGNQTQLKYGAPLIDGAYSYVDGKWVAV